MDEELGYYEPWDGWPIESCGPEYWFWVHEVPGVVSDFGSLPYRWEQPPMDSWEVYEDRWPPDEAA